MVLKGCGSSHLKPVVWVVPHETYDHELYEEGLKVLQYDGVSHRGATSMWYLRGFRVLPFPS